MRTLGTPPPDVPRTRRLLPLALGLLAMGVIGATAYWWLSQPPSVEPVPSPAAPPTTLAPPTSVAGPITGAVEITADVAGARVFLDGHLLGSAPQALERVSEGRHTVRVEKKGYLPFKQDLEVVPGRTARLRARLTAKVEAKPEGFRIDSDVPGAQVFLDREFLGTTPVDVVGIAPGKHRLNVSTEGYEMHAEDIEVASPPDDIMVRFKVVRLDETLVVIHKHGIGSCQGRLIATPAGLRYETSNRKHAFSVTLDQLERFEVDYLKKNLQVRLRGGKKYNFTHPEGSADALLVFHREVEKIRTR